ncbi:hypothetical protein W59_17179, partial [Rhodococcus opacus RKJ300 = JCM 13270]
MSGLLATLTGVSRIRLPPASLCRCDSTTAQVFHLRSVTQRLVAHEITLPMTRYCKVFHVFGAVRDVGHIGDPILALAG